MCENLENLLSIGSGFLEKEQIIAGNQSMQLKEIDLFENTNQIEPKEEIKRSINVEDLDEDQYENNVITTTSSFKSSNLRLSSPWCKIDINTKSDIKNMDKKATLCLSFLGMRVSKPLISSQLFSEKTKDKKIVTIKMLKKHILGDVKKEDWVFGGAIVAKSATKVNQKGSQFSIWTISDLQFDLKTVTLFLFGNAHKELWQSCIGTIVAVLNPTVLERQASFKDKVSLSISNPQHIMILGKSKDLGACKSIRNDGTKCTSFVNINHCEYCIYHVKKEYQRSSQRSELQSNFAGRGLIDLKKKVLGKNQVFYAGKLYTGTQAKQNQLLNKDEKRLKLLSGEGSAADQNLKFPRNRTAVGFDLSHKQKVKDLELLTKLSKSTNGYDAKSETKDNVAGKLLDNFKTIDLNIPISKRRKDFAKINAIKYVQKNGLLSKQDPMNTRGSGLKRSLDESDKIVSISKKPKNEFTSDRYKKMMAATSKHVELFEEVENDLQEKYFKKLESKEQMEEKMCQTYKLDCKAVRCLQCKYTSFSASDKCKANHHPLRIFDTVKRFFMCKNCKNRVVVLTLVPVVNCKYCGCDKWEKTSIMKEKNIDKLHCLSIRGGEQTFLNSAITNDNLDLLVSDS